MEAESLVKHLLKIHLQMGEKVDNLNINSELLGAFPELDSMGVVMIITALEENLGIAIDDDEINAEVFNTLGSLVTFVRSKL